MAHIHEERVVLKFSKLVRDSGEVKPIVQAELASQLEQVAQELAGKDVIVEIEAIE